MYSPSQTDILVQRAVDSVTRAIEYDTKHSYEEAIRFYNDALDLFEQARTKIGTASSLPLPPSASLPLTCASQN